MSNRNYPGPAMSATLGAVYIDYSAVLQGTGAVTLPHGEGVASLVYAGSTGTYTLTLQDGFRYAITAMVDIEASGGGDGAYASIGAPSNEGNGQAVTFPVFTHAASGTLTNFTGRRLKFNSVLKNSSVGK